MIKRLLLILILPSLLFGKFYSIENENDGSCGYVQTYSHTHHHEHENDTHAHSHIHFVKTSNILIDSLLFLIQDNMFTPTLNTNDIVDVNLYISSNITQDLFRPPIIA